MSNMHCTVHWRTKHVHWTVQRYKKKHKTSKCNTVDTVSQNPMTVTRELDGLLLNLWCETSSSSCCWPAGQPSWRPTPWHSGPAAWRPWGGAGGASGHGYCAAWPPGCALQTRGQTTRAQTGVFFWGGRIDSMSLIFLHFRGHIGPFAKATFVATFIKWVSSSLLGNSSANVLNHYRYKMSQPFEILCKDILILSKCPKHKMCILYVQIYERKKWIF